MAITTSKTFKKEETKREKWIKLFVEEEKITCLRDTDCQEIADLLKEKPDIVKVNQLRDWINQNQNDRFSSLVSGIQLKYKIDEIFGD